MSTMGWLRRTLPVEPWKPASPKVNTPPSLPTSQYPPPSGVAAMPTMDWLRRVLPREPWKGASPKVNTPPLGLTSQ